MNLKRKDPYRIPAFGISNRLARSIWWLMCLIFFKYSPKPFHAWRRWVLICFGAKIGAKCAIYPSVKIWAPWNLCCEDMVAIADGAEIYNPSKVFIGSHAIISQGAYICGASHDLNAAGFPLYSHEIYIGKYAWICARAAILPGVLVGDGSVIGLGGVATKNLLPWSIYAGNPAKLIKQRVRHA